jgi:hypothetical protein
MRGYTTGKLIVLVLLAAALLLGWWALGTRRTRSLSPPTVYSGSDGRVEDVSGLVAFVDVSVIAMESEMVLPRQTVIVADREITAVGPARTTSIPAGSHRVDGRGRYLMPGLTDAHTHVVHREDLLPYVANGVTSIVNMGNEPDPSILELRDKVMDGEVLGPTLYVSRFVDGSRDQGEGHPYLVHSADAARSAAIEAKSEGYDLIKVYNSLPTEFFLALMDEAEKQGIAVVGHGVRESGMQGLLEAGQVMVVHAEEYLYTHFSRTTDTTLIPSAVEMTLDAGAYVVPNLSAYEIIAQQWGSQEALDELLVMPGTEVLHPDWREYWSGGRYLDREGNIADRLEFLRRFTRELNDAGVPLLLGTDSPPIPGMLPGFSIHEDIRNMSVSGLTPYESLVAGTRNAGAFFRKHVPESEPFGTVATGQRADLILLDENPLQDVTNVKHRSGVMVRGRWLSEAKLQGLLRELARSLDSEPAEVGER